MASKAQRRKNKRKRRQGQVAGIGADPQNSPPTGSSRASSDQPTAKPTPERYRRGKWAEGKGQMVDVACDMIGRLQVEKKLTDAEAEAARLFQEIHSAYVADLGVGQYKSCLAGGSGGYDNGDGNIEVARAYAKMVDRIGRVNTACLKMEVYKLDGESPSNLAVLRNALNVLAGG